MKQEPLDLKTLTSLFGDDLDTQKAILDEYSRSLSAYRREFDVAIEARSAEGVQAVAHKMKSSSRTVGAIPLANLCDVLELAGKHADWEKIESSTPVFVVLIQDVRTCIAET
mgnify:CR=1 FL=1